MKTGAGDSAPGSFKYVGAVVGISAAITYNALPAYKKHVEIAFLTTTVAILLGYGICEFRKTPNFFRAIYTAVALHVVLSFALWKFLPLPLLYVLVIGVVESFLMAFVCTPFLEPEISFFRNFKSLLKRK